MYSTGAGSVRSHAAAGRPANLTFSRRRGPCTCRRTARHGGLDLDMGKVDTGEWPTYGLAARAHSVLAGLAAAASAQAAGPITISDDGTVSPHPSTLDLNGYPPFVEDVDVRILAHSFPDELDIALVAPGGQGVILMSDVAAAKPMCDPDLRFGRPGRDAATELPISSPVTVSFFPPTTTATLPMTTQSPVFRSPPLWGPRSPHSTHSTRTGRGVSTLSTTRAAMAGRSPTGPSTSKCALQAVFASPIPRSARRKVQRAARRYSHRRQHRRSATRRLSELGGGGVSGSATTSVGPAPPDDPPPLCPAMSSCPRTAPPTSPPVKRRRSSTSP